MELDTIKQQTTWNDAAGSINNNFLKIHQAIVALEANEGSGSIDPDELAQYLENYYTKDESNTQFASLKEYNSLKERFNTLYNALTEDSEGVIDTWNEVVNFINEYSGEENLSQILSKMNEDIASRLKKEDFESWKTESFNPLSEKVNSIGSLSSKIAEFERMFEWDGTSIKAKADLYSIGQLAAGGKATDGSGGGANIMLLTEWDDSLSNLDEYALGANLGSELKQMISDIENQSTKVSVSNLLQSGTLIGTIKVDNIKHDLYAPTPSLEGCATKEWVSQNYLSSEGGKITGDLRIDPGSGSKTIYLGGQDYCYLRAGGNDKLTIYGDWGIELNTDDEHWVNVNGNPILTADALEGYATLDDIPSLEGYATTDWVERQGYLTSIPDDYVTKSDLEEKNYATESWVEEQLEDYLPLTGGEITGKLTVNTLIIGSVQITADGNALRIDGDAYATGQLAAGGGA